MRYFFKSPIVWLEEVQAWMIVWTIFSGGSYAFRKKAHVAIDVLTEKLPEKTQIIVEWFGYICTVFVLGFFFYYSLKLNIQFYTKGKTTAILRIPSWKIYWMATFGSLWMALSATYSMVKSYFLKETDKEEIE